MIGTYDMTELIEFFWQNKNSVLKEKLITVSNSGFKTVVGHFKRNERNKFIKEQNSLAGSEKTNQYVLLINKASKMNCAIFTLKVLSNYLNHSWRKFLSQRNQSIDCKSIDWFLNDRDLRHERLKSFLVHVPIFELLKTTKNLWFYFQEV